MNKWRNYGLWVSIASTVLLLIQVAGVGIDANKYNIIVNAILGTLTIAGIISNPEKGKGYTDK